MLVMTSCFVFVLKFDFAAQEFHLILILSLFLSFKFFFILSFQCHFTLLALFLFNAICLNEYCDFWGFCLSRELFLLSCRLFMPH